MRGRRAVMSSRRQSGLGAQPEHSRLRLAGSTTPAFDAEARLASASSAGASARSGLLRRSA